MLIQLRPKQGQTTVEYAVLVIIIIGALLTMQDYMKRGLQGKFKSSADDIGDQYSPGNTEVEIITSSVSNTDDEFGTGNAGIGASYQGLQSGQANQNKTLSKSLVSGTEEYYGSKADLESPDPTRTGWQNTDAYNAAGGSEAGSLLGELKSDRSF